MSSLRSSDPTWWRNKRIKRSIFTRASAIFVYGGHNPHAQAVHVISVRETRDWALTLTGM